jgi:hypothetical protein
MNKWHLRFLRLAYFGLAAILPIYALADYNGTQGAGIIFRAFDSTHGGTSACAAATTQCAAVGLINSAGAEIGTAGTPVRVDPTGTTPQPISAAALPLPAGAATSALQGTNTATTAHTCSTAGFSELGCLGQINDSINLPIPAGTAHIGTVGTAPYPDTAVPYTSSTTGTTTAITATLAGAASVTTYICGFSVRANATAAQTNNIVVSGTVSGSLNFTQWTAPLATGLGVSEQIFSPCIPASAANTSIVVTTGAAGASGTISVAAWGYKL